MLCWEHGGFNFFRCYSFLFQSFAYSWQWLSSYLMMAFKLIILTSSVWWKRYWHPSSGGLRAALLLYSICTQCFYPKRKKSMYFNVSTITKKNNCPHSSFTGLSVTSCVFPFLNDEMASYKFQWSLWKISAELGGGNRDVLCQSGCFMSAFRAWYTVKVTGFRRFPVLPGGVEAQVYLFSMLTRFLHIALTLSLT